MEILTFGKIIGDEAFYEQILLHGMCYLQAFRFSIKDNQSRLYASVTRPLRNIGADARSVGGSVDDQGVEGLDPKFGSGFGISNMCLHADIRN